VKPEIEKTYIDPDVYADSYSKRTLQKTGFIP
jgi:hypothetical protein